MAVTPSEFYPPQDGDCVIQTSDDILFGVHRLFLKSASPVFSYMLGKTCDSQTPATITENSVVFQDLLSFIYPDKIPTVFPAFRVLAPVLDAASKYEMRGVMGALSIQLISKTSKGGTFGSRLMRKDPLWVYAKAKYLGLDEVANAAANATLNIDITIRPQDNPDIADMPPSWLWDLLELRREHEQSRKAEIPGMRLGRFDGTRPERRVEDSRQMP